MRPCVRPDLARTARTKSSATSMPIRQALRTDLEAHRCQPDGIGRAGAHHCGDHRNLCRPADHVARHRHRDPVRRLPDPVPGRPGRRSGRGRLARLPASGRRRKATKARDPPAQHFTEPPPRYSEACLVKKLEELGIGRPSTYASILPTLRDRKYVRLDKSGSIPRTAAGSSPPSLKASSPNTSNMISPRVSRKNSM